jgi:hypothetical protein
LDWLYEEGQWSRLNEAVIGSRKHHRGVLRNADGDSPFNEPPFNVAEVVVLLADEQRRMAGRGYDGRIIGEKANSTWFGLGESLT